jgi:hypothetical protein
MIPFAEYSDKVQEHLELKYGIRVLTTDVPDPLTGDLDGAEIQIDYAVTPEERLFLLLHLFGHTVQWNTNPLSFEIGSPRRPPVNPALLPALMDYEQEAAGYGVGLLRELGITGVDQWLSDYTACDRAYLRHYYLTGEKKEFRSFWRHNAPRVPPRPAPAFTPTRRTWRHDGVVI